MCSTGRTVLPSAILESFSFENACAADCALSAVMHFTLSSGCSCCLGKRSTLPVVRPFTYRGTSFVNTLLRLQHWLYRSRASMWKSDSTTFSEMPILRSAEAWN